MERSTTNVSPSEEPLKEAIGRRQLLKALAATGGAFATFLLPGQWSKPVVEAGELSAHAQASPVPVNPTYIALCDSTPGGGNLANTPTIVNIQPYIQLFSGTGPLEGIEATMTVDVITGSPSFGYTFPQYSVTNALGRASFPDLSVSGVQDDTFWLVFTFATVGGPVVARCGEFYYDFPTP